jgi:NAD(P)H-hydrate epimerase
MKNIVASSKLVAGLIPPRSKRSKKGDNGVVLVVGGSRIYHGAPLIASLAAMRSGVDLVYVAVPKSIAGPVRSYSPSLIVLPLPDDRLTPGSVNRLISMLPKKVDAAAIGMGMSLAKTEALTNLIAGLNGMNAKLVLDASALIPDVIPAVTGRHAVLTPHAGEFRRVSRQELGESEEDRIKTVKGFAAKHSLTILLKAWTDIISDGRRVALNRTHSCAMTVGGTGDALSGLVAGLLAKRMSPLDAAVAGAYINGAAGELAYRKYGLHIMPTDVVENIPAVMKKFDRISAR